MDRIGVEAPKLRKMYKIEIDAMVSQIAKVLLKGEPKEAIARWASAERVRIAERARESSGVVGRAVYTIRDWRKYGPGGRAWANVEKRDMAKGVSGDAMYDHIIKGAQKSNATVDSNLGAQ